MKNSININDFFVAVPKENSKVTIIPRDDKSGVSAQFTAEIDCNEILDNFIKSCNKEN